MHNDTHELVLILVELCEKYILEGEINNDNN